MSMVQTLEETLTLFNFVQSTKPQWHFSKYQRFREISKILYSIWGRRNKYRMLKKKRDFHDISPKILIFWYITLPLPPSSMDDMQGVLTLRIYTLARDKIKKKICFEVEQLDQWSEPNWIDCLWSVSMLMTLYDCLLKHLKFFFLIKEETFHSQMIQG